MASKQIALGSLFKIDIGVGFVTQPLIQSLTPPPRAREKVDAKALGDTLDVPLLGIEAASEMELMQYWHPGDTEHEKFDTLFNSKAEFEVQEVTPHATPVTDEYTCQVVGLAPETKEPNGVYKRKVTLQRTTAITRT